MEIFNKIDIIVGKYKLKYILEQSQYPSKPETGNKVKKIVKEIITLVAISSLIKLLREV